MICIILFFIVVLIFNIKYGIAIMARLMLNKHRINEDEYKEYISWTFLFKQLWI